MYLPNLSPPVKQVNQPPIFYTTCISTWTIGKWLGLLSWLFGVELQWLEFQGGDLLYHVPAKPISSCETKHFVSNLLFSLYQYMGHWKMARLAELALWC